jgi:hypothetical protein
MSVLKGATTSCELLKDTAPEQVGLPLLELLDDEVLEVLELLDDEALVDDAEPESLPELDPAEELVPLPTELVAAPLLALAVLEAEDPDDVELTLEVVAPEVPLGAPELDDVEVMALEAAVLAPLELAVLDPADPAEAVVLAAEVEALPVDPEPLLEVLWEEDSPVLLAALDVLELPAAAELTVAPLEAVLDGLTRTHAPVAASQVEPAGQTPGLPTHE